VVLAKTKKLVSLLEIPRVLPITAKVGVGAGLLPHLGVRGIGVLAKGLLDGRTNPSLIYRFQASIQPSKVAIRWGERRITFLQLDAEIDRVCTGLGALGLGRGSTALFMLENRPELIVLLAAMSRMGAAGVAISYRSTVSELSFLVNHSGARVLVCSAKTAPVVREAMGSFEGLQSSKVYCVDREDGLGNYDDLPVHQECASPEDGEDSAVIIYTSGTTGTPKGAVRKFPRNAMIGTLQVLASSPIRTDDIHLAVLPFYHATSYVFTSYSHAVGATVVIQDRFEPRGFLEAIEKYRVTQTALVPTLLRQVVRLG